jgi:hypothetical protein
MNTQARSMAVARIQSAATAFEQVCYPMPLDDLQRLRSCAFDDSKCRMSYGDVHCGIVGR